MFIKIGLKEKNDQKVLLKDMMISENVYYVYMYDC